MNNNNEQDGIMNTTPYRASGNLNTVIGNPSVNINDTMNVNIQSIATDVPNSNNIQTSNPQVVNNSFTNSNFVSNDINNSLNNNKVDSGTQNSVTNNNANRTYVTTDNRPKKKNISLNFGPEFKIVLLIIVVLLVFVFLLPMISDMFRGY